MKHADEQIPQQLLGRQTDFSYSLSFATTDEAHARFLKVAERMVDVSNWHLYTGAGSSFFKLTNNLGEEIGGWAEEGLYFYIDLTAAPGSDAGHGLEWVRIERIEADGNQHTNEEFIAMTVRPVPDPRTDDAAVAHFFSDASTSTFIASRYGFKVGCEQHGRNETPNKDGVDLYDKMRNTAIALSARLGLSGIQWQKLVEGIVEGVKVGR